MPRTVYVISEYKGDQPIRVADSKANTKPQEIYEEMKYGAEMRGVLTPRIQFEEIVVEEGWTPPYNFVYVIKAVDGEIRVTSEKLRALYIKDEKEEMLLDSGANDSRVEIERAEIEK